MNKIVTALFTLALSACGSGSDSPTPDQPPVVDPDNQLNLQAITAGNGVFNSDLGGITTLNKVLALDNDELLVLGETSIQAEYGHLQGMLAITDQQGKTHTLQKNENGFADACVHPSGEYSVAAFLPSSDKFHQIEIQRFSSNHELLYTAPMVAIALEDKYEINFNPEEWQTDPFEIIENTHKNIDNKYTQHSLSWGRFGLVSFNCDQEELLVAYNNAGQKLAKYSANLTFQWEEVLSIYYWGNNERKDISAKVVHADNGDIYVIDTLTSNAIPAYNHRFNSNIPLAENTRQTTNHILFKHLDLQGDLISEKLLTSVHSQFLKDIALHNGHLYVGSISYLKKSDTTNNSKELDISLINIHLQDDTYTQTFHDVDNEDWLNGITLDGNSLYLFGHTGGNQLDSNSWVKDSKALYARYDINQQTLETTTIQHERSSEIKDLIIIDNTVIAVGSTNAPITHSADVSSEGLFVSH